MDSETVVFGIRETGNYFDEKIKARVFTVNGQKVFIKGGNWIASDALAPSYQKSAMKLK